MGLKYVNNDICYPSILVTGRSWRPCSPASTTQPHRCAHHPDRWWLPRHQLHRPHPQGAHDSGHPRCPSGSSPPQAAWTRTTPASTSSSPSCWSRPCTPFSTATSSCSCSTACVPLRGRGRLCRRPLRPHDGRGQGRSAGALLAARSTRCASARSTRFEALPLVNDRSKPRVGVVGEILVKFHPTANNQVVRVIEQEAARPTCPAWWTSSCLA